MSLAYTMPDIDMPILPEAPGLYALKAVTHDRGRTGRRQRPRQQLPAGDRRQPGHRVRLPAMRQRPRHGDDRARRPASSSFTNPLPVPPAAARQLAPRRRGRPPPRRTTSPRGDGSTTCPPTRSGPVPADGDAAAYYGYDLNVEFNETYVNALYTTFLTASTAPWDYPGPQLPPAVHMRCVDRNQRTPCSRRSPPMCRPPTPRARS